MNVSKTEYPKIFEAIESLRSSNGAINRLEPQQATYDVPDADLTEVEAGLSKLLDDEFDVFVDGDAAEAAELVEKYGIIDAAIFLEEYFERFI